MRNEDGCHSMMPDEGVVPTAVTSNAYTKVFSVPTLFTFYVSKLKCESYGGLGMYMWKTGGDSIK